MGMRNPLKSGQIIKMPNQGQYVIGEKIGEGGLSLVYSAKTKGNDYPVVIKEFFPAKHAVRAKKTIRADDGTIIEKKDRVYPEMHHAEHFFRCLSAFEQEGRLGSAAHIDHFQIICFSDCGNGYAVLPRWSNDTCSFDDLVMEWEKNPPVSADPVFVDHGRILFALTAINSLLSVLHSIHEQNMLHLDITPSNVVWAGQNRISPEHGMALLTDFGCSVLMANDTYPAEYVLSYSIEYAAPEYLLENGELTKATDVFSVGRLLMFLCFGQKAFYKHATVSHLITQMRIRERDKSSLLTIIQKATNPDMDKRYQTAKQMQESVCQLLKTIPIHPINPDNTTAFTLYSLKTMLEGSLDTHYSWAHEVCDRRGLILAIPESLHHPVANIAEGHFADDESFLRSILPVEIFDFIWKQIVKDEGTQYSVRAIMSGNYPKEWKADICKKFENYGLTGLFKRCRTLLHSEYTFKESIRFLLRLPGRDISYFERCYSECAFELVDAPYKGLALLVLFALLGQEEAGFVAFAQHSPSDIAKMMRC